MNRIFWSLLFALVAHVSTTNAQCSYTLVMADDFGDGWNGGSLTIVSGSNSEEFTLGTGLSVDTVSFMVTAGQPISFEWSPGLYDFEVSFQIFNDLDALQLSVVAPSSGQLGVGLTAQCITCLEPIDFKIENIYDTRVKLRWLPDGTSISAAQSWTLIYGVKGFIPENKVGDTLTVNQPKATITGLQKKSEYDVYLIQKCADGSYSRRVGPLSFKTYWTNDVAITGVDSPRSSCDLDVETVTIRLSNLGSAPQSLIPFRYYVNGQDAGVSQPNDGFYTGVLGKDSTAVIPFEATYDFSDPGEYRIDVVSEMMGDEDVLNDTFTYYVVNRLVAPYTQDFESWNGAWSVDEDASELASWVYGTPQKDFISAAASGSNAWLTGGLDGEYNDYEKSYLVSPCYDFSAMAVDPALDFSIIYDTEEGVDGAWLELSVNDGQNWTKVGSQGTGINWYNTASPQVDDFWSGNSGRWLTARSVLTGTAGKSNVRLRFVFYANGFNTGEGVGIDDIRIDSTNALDLAASFVKTEGESNSPCGKALDKVIFTYANFGATPLIADQLAYSIDGGAPVIATPVLPALQPNQSQTYTFNNTFDSRDKRVVIRCWVIATGDQSGFNDTTTYVLDRRPRELPYFEDFEASENLPEAWTTTAGNVDEEHGENTAQTNVFAINFYSDNATFTTTGPRVGLLDANSSRFRFSYRMVQYDDESLPVVLLPGVKIDVQASKDCGLSFQNIYTINSGNHPLSTDMRKITVPLSGFTGEDFQFRFKGTLGLAGLALDFWLDIDSVEVISCSAGFDLSANVLAPVPGKNNGQAALEINGGIAPYTFLWSNGATTQSIDNLPAGPLFVTVTDYNGCSQTLEVQVGATATDEIFGLTNVALFPNPARESLTVQLNFDAERRVDIELLDLMGRSLMDKRHLDGAFIQERLDVSSLPGGVYLIRISADGKTLTRKIVVE